MVLLPESGRDKNDLGQQVGRHEKSFSFSDVRIGKRWVARRRKQNVQKSDETYILQSHVSRGSGWSCTAARSVLMKRLDT